MLIDAKYIENNQKKSSVTGPSLSTFELSLKEIIAITGLSKTGLMQVSKTRTKKREGLPDKIYKPVWKPLDSRFETVRGPKGYLKVVFPDLVNFYLINLFKTHKVGFHRAVCKFLRIMLFSHGQNGKRNPLSEKFNDIENQHILRIKTFVINYTGQDHNGKKDAKFEQGHIFEYTRNNKRMAYWAFATKDDAFCYLGWNVKGKDYASICKAFNGLDRDEPFLLTEVNLNAVFKKVYKNYSAYRDS